MSTSSQYFIVAGIMAQLTTLQWKTDNKFLAVFNGIVALSAFAAGFLGYQPT